MTLLSFAIIFPMSLESSPCHSESSSDTISCCFTGGYFVGGGDDFGQEHDLSVVNYNDPPNGQPSLWCQWVAIDNEHIGWNNSYYFYGHLSIMSSWVEGTISSFPASFQ